MTIARLSLFFGALVPALARDLNRLLAPVEGRCGWSEQGICVIDHMPICDALEDVTVLTPGVDIAEMSRNLDLDFLADVCYLIEDDMEILHFQVHEVQFACGLREMRPYLNSRYLLNRAQEAFALKTISPAETEHSTVMWLQTWTRMCSSAAMSSKGNCESAGFCQWKPRQTRNASIAEENDGQCLVELWGALSHRPNTSAEVWLMYEAHCSALKTRDECLGAENVILGNLAPVKPIPFLTLASMTVLIMFLSMLCCCPMPKLPRELFKVKSVP